MSERALRKRVEELEARLAAVEDTQAIQNLKSRYGQLADARYGPEGVVPRAQLETIAGKLAAHFTEDAVWDGGAGLGLCEGRDAIFNRFLEPTLKFSWHYFVKPRIEVDGDYARATWDILAPCTTRDDRAMWMSGVEAPPLDEAPGRLHGAARPRLGAARDGSASTVARSRSARRPEKISAPSGVRCATSAKYAESRKIGWENSSIWIQSAPWRHPLFALNRDRHVPRARA